MNARTVSPKVLLVEDDLRLSELVRTYLQSNGFRVAVESRGDRVVDRVQSECPDLIVLDLGLPGQNGFAVCKAVARPSIACRSSSSRHATATSIMCWGWSSVPMTSSSSRWSRGCWSRGFTRC